MSRRILLAEIRHETNTFNRIPTTRRDFASRYWLEGDAIPETLRDTNTEICGFLDAAAKRGWSVTHPFAASASPSGPMAAGDWHEVIDLITTPLKTRTFDAVALVLHGAMVTETTLDADGDIIAAVRALAGPDTLIGVTLDMHANVSERMTGNADIMLAYRTYPHVDQYERAQHFARLFDRVFDSGERPRLYRARRPMMDAANHGQTADGQPMPDLLRIAEEIESEPGILCASIQVGFPWADVPDQGPSVVITGTDPERAGDAAERLIEAMWNTRDRTQVRFPEPQAAITAARAGKPGDPPLVLADFADNPAGGAYGDSPNLLRHMLEAGLANAAFATISDPDAVAAARKAGEGATVCLNLGGKGAPDITPPLAVTGTVIRLTDGNYVCAGPMWQGVRFSMGQTAVIRVDDIEVIVSSVPTSVMDLNVFRSAGIEPTQKTTLAVKSRNHFKAAYGPIARQTMLVDAGGIASMKLAELDFKNIPRPVWPLDDAVL